VNIRDFTDHEPWEAGDIVQLVPGKTGNPMFEGCLMIVTELKSWGVMGYVQALGQDGKPGGQAYYRARFEEVEWCGKATWWVR
jgi:hypothetical protein